VSSGLAVEPADLRAPVQITHWSDHITSSWEQIRGFDFLALPSDPEPQDAGTHKEGGRLTNVLGGLIGGLGSIPGAIAAFPDDTDFLLRTPEALSYRNDQVQQFASATRVLANGLLVVVTLVGGYNVLLRPYLGAAYPGALEFLPRLLLGGILINTANWWTRLAIDVNNASCGVFGAGPPPALDDAFWRASFPTNLIVGLIYVVMGLLLVLQQLMRLALVDVLLVLAPVAALCWILPQAQGWGRLWGSLFIGTVFAQCVQVSRCVSASTWLRRCLR